MEAKEWEEAALESDRAAQEAAEEDKRTKDQAALDTKAAYDTAKYWKDNGDDLVAAKQTFVNANPGDTVAAAELADMEAATAAGKANHAALETAKNEAATAKAAWAAAEA